jgi:hypothetical protein
MKEPRGSKIELPAPRDVAELECVWDAFADSCITAGCSVGAKNLATEPKCEVYRRLLDLNCLRQHPERSHHCIYLPRIVLTVAPSALFLAENLVWTQQRLAGARFPSYNSVVAVPALMQATDGVAEKWGFAFAGALHLAAQCVMLAWLKRRAVLWDTERQLERRGLVQFTDLMPGAIIGCRCADLRYVVRDEFAHTVDCALTRADFQKLRDASCVHTQAPDQAAIGSAFAAECGDKAVVVAAQHKFHDDASELQVDEWFDAAADFMRGHPNVGEFRVLLCVTGVSPEALEGIKTRAANKDDRLSRAIIVDPASAPQFFERFGLWTFVEALKDC